MSSRCPIILRILSTSLFSSPAINSFARGICRSRPSRLSQGNLPPEPIVLYGMHQNFSSSFLSLDFFLLPTNPSPIKGVAFRSNYRFHYCTTLYSLLLRYYTTCFTRIPVRPQSLFESYASTMTVLQPPVTNGSKSNSKLFTPLKLGRMELKHRIIMAPMTRARSPGHIPDQNVVEYYSQRASEGCLIITEATHISVMVNLFN